jgi:hypothetical protein
MVGLRWRFSHSDFSKGYEKADVFLCITKEEMNCKTDVELGSEGNVRRNSCIYNLRLQQLAARGDLPLCISVRRITASYLRGSRVRLPSWGPVILALFLVRVLLAGAEMAPLERNVEGVS